MTSSSKILSLVASFTILVHATPLPPPAELPIYERTIFTNISDTFDWKDIKPNPELEYHDCGGNFKCARLELPLNWNASGPEDVTYNMKFNMAIVKLPAFVPITDPRYGGPILINPGGPGSSGIDFAINRGVQLQARFDAGFLHNSTTYVVPNETAKYFDIIGFDPRGVHHSTPFHTCFRSYDEQREYIHGNSSLSMMWPGQNLESIWQAQTAMGRQCIWDPVTNPNGSVIAKFSSTAMVARDMVEFVERHAQWREKQVSDASTRSSVQWRKGEEPILMYGASYGTVLGATLAAMQPHRIKRLLLDGVSDAKSYYAGNLTTDVLDGDAPLHKLFEYCASAGPGKCGLNAGSSAHTVQKYFEELLASLRLRSPDRDDEIQMLEKRILDLGYGPISSWPQFVDTIKAFTSDARSLAKSEEQVSRDDDLIDPYDPSTVNRHMATFWNDMIQGGDQTAHPLPTDFAKGQWRELRDALPFTGDAWARNYLGTFTWPIVFKWRFGDQQPVASNVTANPILFASNLVDGVTGLPSARLMQGRFKGSGLLITDGEGHTSEAEPSLCYAKVTRHYFQTGELPDTSKHCLPAKRPFVGSEGPNTEQTHWDKLTKEEKVMFNSVANCPSGNRCPPV